MFIKKCSIKSCKKIKHNHLCQGAMFRIAPITQNIPAPLYKQTSDCGHKWSINDAWFEKSPFLNFWSDKTMCKSKAITHFSLRHKMSGRILSPTNPFQFWRPNMAINCNLHMCGIRDVSPLTQFLSLNSKFKKKIHIKTRACYF